MSIDIGVKRRQGDSKLSCNVPSRVADGTVTYAGGSATYPAHLLVLGGRQFRLDVDGADGKASTVMSGVKGAFLPAKGRPSSISSEVSTLGFLTFPRLFSSDYPTAQSILTDRGGVTVDGKTLERITLDDPTGNLVGQAWNTEDLYFDTATGRLAMTAALVHLSSSDNALYMLETTYSDYRTVNGLTLPYTYAQSINGQLSWTLSLTTLDTQAIPAPAAFTY